MCEPWTAFLEEEVAAKALKTLAERTKTISPKQILVAKALLRRVNHHAMIQELSPIIMRFKLYDAASDVLQKWLPLGMSGDVSRVNSFDQAERSWISRAPAQKVTLFAERDIADLVEEANSDGARLLAAGAGVSHAMAMATLAALRKRSAWTPDDVITFSPVLQVLDVAGTFDASFATALAKAALQSGGAGCHDLVCAIAESSETGRSGLAVALSEASANITGASSGPILALMHRLQKLDSEAFAHVGTSITEIALRWEVSILSDDSDLSEQFVATLKTTSESGL